MDVMVQQYIAAPQRLTANELWIIVVDLASRKPSVKLWTSSRILKQLGEAWDLPENRQLLWRIDRLLRELEERGLLAPRPQHQTSRNPRDEYAFVFTQTDEPAA
jgi:hypothetical protein